MALVFNGITGFQDTGTGALGLPAGSTAQRPSNAANGFMRYNTETNVVESYVNGAWVSTASASYTVDYLVVAGGGGGGS